jgi:hypothetical protein
MLEKYITPARIANSILLKSNFKGTYLIVEGNSDFALYRKFVVTQFCQIEIAFGYQNVLDVISELSNRGFHDAIGLIDTDFRLLDEEVPTVPDVIVTDFHDLDLMIFMSEALETILAHYAKPNKIDALLAELQVGDIRSIFLELALPLAYLKWANKHHNFGLVFKPLTADGKPLNVSKFISVDTLEFKGYDDMIKTVIDYSSNKSEVTATLDKISQLTKEMVNKSNDMLQLCNGHDVVSIFALSLRKKLSNLNANAVTSKHLENELIFSYDSRYFEQTDLYKRIKSWEKAKQKQVLKF